MDGSSCGALVASRQSQAAVSTAEPPRPDGTPERPLHRSLFFLCLGRFPRCEGWFTAPVSSPKNTPYRVFSSQAEMGGSTSRYGRCDKNCLINWTLTRVGLPRQCFLDSHMFAQVIVASGRRSMRKDNPYLQCLIRLASPRNKSALLMSSQSGSINRGDFHSKLV